MSEENVTRFLQVITNKNLTPRAPVPPESILDESCHFRIATLEKRIEMKQEITPPRDKDLFDLARLREIKERKHGK